MAGNKLCKQCNVSKKRGLVEDICQQCRNHNNRDSQHTTQQPLQHQPQPLQQPPPLQQQHLVQPPARNALLTRLQETRTQNSTGPVDNQAMNEVLLDFMIDTKVLLDFMINTKVLLDFMIDTKEDLPSATHAAIPDLASRPPPSAIPTAAPVSENVTSSSQDDALTMEQEERTLKMNLQWSYMTPIQKICARYNAPKKILWRKLPWKILLVLITVYTGTLLLWKLSNSTAVQVSFGQEQKDSLKQVFLPEGNIVSYRKFYGVLDHSVAAYKDIETDELSSYSRNSPLNLCVEHLGNNTELDKQCFLFNEETWNGSHSWLEEKSQTIPWASIQRISLNFSLLTVGPLNGENCFKLNNVIVFEKSSNAGQILIDLTMFPEKLNCLKNGQQEDETSFPYFLLVLFCLASLFLWTNHLLKAQKLRLATEKHNWNSTLTDNLNLSKPWCRLIFLSNILIIISCVLKFYTDCDVSLILGIGSFWSFLGLLGYLRLFKSYQLQFNTILKDWKFFLGSFFLFFGYVFLGHFLFSPYHHKFETIMSTTAGLFALVHGDDIFATFKDMPQDDILLLLGCMFYLFTFICFFIGVFLPQFLALYSSSYDLCKKQLEDSRDEKFYDTSEIDFSSEQDDEGSANSWLNFLRINRRSLGRNQRRNDYEALE